MKDNNKMTVDVTNDKDLSKGKHQKGTLGTASTTVNPGKKC